MKLLNKTTAGLLAVMLLLPGLRAFSQDAKKNSLNIAVNYFVDNNKIPYAGVKVKSKIDGRFKPIGDIELKLYLNKDSSGNFIGKVVTDDKGEAKTIIPASLKTAWAASQAHTFVATFDGNKKFDATTADVTVARAKIAIDTAGGDGSRKVIATLYELRDSGWKPVKGVDVIIAIKRLAADLNVNETATFTTDSTGKASADFKRDSIPGDAHGNIILIAKVEDNDQYGSLSVEKTVPWGAKFVPLSAFNNRTLFARGSKAPIWLILMAGSIIIAVWGVLIGLVLNLLRIKKLGQQV